MFIIVTLLFIAACSPLLYAAFSKTATKRTKKISVITNVASSFGVVLLVTIFSLGTTVLAAAEGDAATVAASGLSVGSGIGLIGAALVTGLSCLGSGIAVSAAASAAIGAISENEKVFTKALIFVVLAEGIAIYGMLISILILGKIV